jgi:hypothetical protein
MPEFQGSNNGREAMTELTLSDQVSDQELKRVDLTGDVPDVICAECAKNAMVYAPLGVAATYCVHSATGAWRIRDHEWTLTTPINAAPFTTRLRMMLALVKLRLNQTRH